MTRLFITLYLMVFASFGVFALYGTIIELIGQSTGAVALIDERASIGTFKLLDDSINGLNKQQTDLKIEQYKKIFGNEFKLVELSSLELDKEQVKKLKQGRVVNIEKDIYLDKEKKILEEEDATILYFQRPNTSLVWTTNLDIDVSFAINGSDWGTTVTSGKFSKGMMLLLQKELPADSPQTWASILKKMEPDYRMPLRLRDKESVNNSLLNNSFPIPAIEGNNIVNITQGTNFITLVQQIPNSSKLIQIGPVEIPWYMRNYMFLFIAAFVLSFATTLLLWIWPLWSNLIKIKKAADDFGDGNYDKRVSFGRFSPIANISKAFNSMADRTQHSIRSQKELTSAVSHELRTPVARMRFALSMLDTSDNKKDKTRYINAINEDINELDILLEELLNYARFDQKEAQITPTIVKLVPWLDRSMEKLLPLANDKQLQYKIEAISSDESNSFEPRLMSRVLNNLVQNALRYAKKKVGVTLKKGQDNYILTVEDDGTGIPKNQRDNVFNPFSRLDPSRDRASGGFGLGLAIVSQIIKAHHGTISIHDSSLGGAKFIVRIPNTNNN